ncbi:unnamed protein product [Euphydryas editha]|uniref:Neuroblastoma-amplified sequence n=1 Tax=Euphydryas editha TaxID=104508 RepID=A0AAU9UU94_EUPED|nr:unnamed protein product [Euphydryas editha]
MSENKSILHELYVFSEWKPEPEYLQKPDNILPENISSLWRWLKFFGPKKSLIDSVTAHKEKQQKWHIALGDEGKVIAVLTDNILEIRTKRSEYATIAARTTVARDAYAQWRKIVWSPDCSFLVIAYGNGIVSFFDLTASNLFNIPADCSRPGGLECTDNTHAVSDIIFMPLRVKDTKWNWEVVVVTFDGRLRGYLVSQTEGFKLHHAFQFAGGVAAACYCEPHASLYVAGVPRLSRRNAEEPSAASMGLTAWRVLHDEPFYKLSVVSDELDGRLANERFQLYLPFIFNKNLDFIVRMAVSKRGTRLACAHASGAVSLWRLPVLRCERRVELAQQPQHALRSPLVPRSAPARRSRDPADPTDPAVPTDPTDPADPADTSAARVADLAWWSEEEIILSRFSGAVSVCELENLQNILGKKPEFFQGTPQVTNAYDGVFMVLECETNIVPAKKSRSDESMEVVKADEEVDNSMLALAKELFKSVLFAITDMETFQPRPRRISVASRAYRLLAVRSTTPAELFSRKIESGKYTEALTLARTFDLDSDLVYQQQWRKNPVSTEAIQNYLSKVRKKIWAVHQCVDRLPESLAAAHELLHFGLQLTQQKILEEINKDLPEEQWKVAEDVTLEDLNAYTSELLRCRHVMLFYKERLNLYEAILRCEKSTYLKDEYDRLRSNSIVHSAMEIAKEGRIEALTCLWPYIKSLPMQLAVLDMIPETLCPLTYQHLLPTKEPIDWFEKKSPIKVRPFEHENDWCRKEIFRPIWSSNWSEDTTPEGEGVAGVGAGAGGEAELGAWYERRARLIERRSGLASHALHLVTAAAVGGAVPGLERVLFHLLTLDTLLYDVNVEGVALADLERLSNLDTCKLLMQASTPATFIADLKQFVIPFLKRYENLTKRTGVCLTGLIDFLEDISKEDLSYILLVLQSPKEFELDVRTHLELVERCLFAHTGTEQLDMACDLLDTILKDTDGSISHTSLVRRCAELERLVAGSGRLAWRGVRVPPCALRDLHQDHAHARLLLARVARGLAAGDEKPTQQDWENLLKDILELRSTLFDCVKTEECYEIYVLSLLTSGDPASIRLAADVLTVSPAARAVNNSKFKIDYKRSVELVSSAAKEYFNSASSLTDPALEIAKCCLSLIEDGNKEIEQELDLIAALPILNAFNLIILPIQVRLCEDRMTLVEDCLTSDPNAYLASHKLLKLAKLLRIAGDDEQTREGAVLAAVCERALEAGAAGGGAAGAAARRLAALRHAPAAPLLARVAAHAHAHADTPERSRLLAAALAFAPPERLHDMLHARYRPARAPPGRAAPRARRAAAGARGGARARARGHARALPPAGRRARLRAARAPARHAARQVPTRSRAAWPRCATRPPRRCWRAWRRTRTRTRTRPSAPACWPPRSPSRRPSACTTCCTPGTDPLARRLAALRHAPAAPLLARVAAHAHAHADTPERSRLLAAALAFAPPERLHDMLHARYRPARAPPGRAAPRARRAAAGARGGARARARGHARALPPAGRRARLRAARAPARHAARQVPTRSRAAWPRCATRPPRRCWRAWRRTRTRTRTRPSAPACWPPRSPSRRPSACTTCCTPGTDPLARRLAALRHAPAAPLLARVAAHAHAHADTPERSRLLAAALAFAPPERLHDMLHARYRPARAPPGRAAPRARRAAAGARGGARARARGHARALPPAGRRARLRAARAPARHAARQVPTRSRAAWPRCATRPPRRCWRAWRRTRTRTRTRPSAPACWPPRSPSRRPSACTTCCTPGTDPLARRLAALRHAPAAPLLARVAAHAHAHADTPERSRLLAAALAFAPPERLHDMLHARLNLELESLQQMGAALKENHRLEARWPSTEDEFSDAITTPVIEKKDLVSPVQPEKKVPLLNYLLDTFQSKFNISSGKSVPSDTAERTVHCPEFYRSLHPEHGASANYYRYDRFSLPDDLDGESSVGQSVLKWFYIQNTLENGEISELETEVVAKCASELLYKDTALSTACLLRGGGGAGGGAEGAAGGGGDARARLLRAHHSRVAAAAALYAALVAASAPAQRDHAYLAQPKQMAYKTLSENSATEEQMTIIRQCIDKLSGMGEVERIRKLGVSVNGLLFNADQDYRREVIYRLAKSGGAEGARLAVALAQKHALDALGVWLQHAAAAPGRALADALPSCARDHDACDRIRDALWPLIPGCDHAALINLFTILKNIDDKTQMYGLTVTEHIKLLKKAKAVSQDMDYKLLLEQPSAEQFTNHILTILKPENLGLVMKFVRMLPPVLKIPVSITSLYTNWLTKYFFNVAGANNNKKWMQQWRECASYFNKLPKKELLTFVANTCFSEEALIVPPGTRNLMIMQAVDYCQQEQENDYKFNKNEQSWAQVGQQLARWARFLENFHSDSVRALVDACDEPQHRAWRDLEISRGELDSVTQSLGQLVLHGLLRAAGLSSLLQLLGVEADVPRVFERLLQHCERHPDDTGALVERLTQFHAEGVRFPAEQVERARALAAAGGAAPRAQLGLLALAGRRLAPRDLRALAAAARDLLRAEWPGLECAAGLTEESLLTPEGRYEVYKKILAMCTTFRQKKVLVDVLACWPPTYSNGDGRSLHCEYVYYLLTECSDVQEGQLLIKMLLTRPLLSDDDVKWLVKQAGSFPLLNMIWVILLSKCETSESILMNYILENKDLIQGETIGDDLIKEILDQGLFIKMVSTPFYAHIIDYIISNEVFKRDAIIYTSKWAITELMKANYIAEAGSLKLIVNGVPSSLRGFSQSLLCKDLIE